MPRLTLINFALEDVQQIPMFRDRPLTWLFFIATGCVNLVMVMPMLRSTSIVEGDLQHMLFMFGVPAQLSLVAAWGAIGSCHRLTRGALVTLALFLASLTASLSPHSWRDLLTFYMLHALLVCGGTLILRVLGWLQRWPSLADRTHEKLRYSVMELLGWTCIVAIWAFACRHASTRDDFYGLFLANFTMLPLCIIALVGRSESWRNQTVSLLVACGIAVLSARFTAERFNSDTGMILLIGNLTQVTYLALWYCVQRLDLSMQRNQRNVGNDSSNPLKLYQA